MQIFLACFVILFISHSTCVAEEPQEKCEKGNFQLSLYGRRIDDAKWNTSYYLDGTSCNATDSWKMVVQQNVTERGGLRHIRLRGFFTENVNMTCGYIPSQHVVTDIFQGCDSKPHTDENFGANCKGENGAKELEMKVVSRDEWKARKPTREIAAWVKPTRKVYVNFVETPCLDNRICKLAMLKEQFDGIESLGDIRYNFYAGGDGLIYEGRGWDKMHDSDFNLMYFLDGSNPPSRHQLESFGLLIVQGIKMGKISPNFSVAGNDRVLKISKNWFDVMKHA